MKTARLCKLTFTVPISDADVLRSAIAEAGAGNLGNYSHCSFSFRGVGRFMPGAGSNPAIGQPDKLEVVEEEQIQVVIPLEHARDVIQAMIKAHPYEVPAYDLVPIWTIEEL